MLFRPKIIMNSKQTVRFLNLYSPETVLCEQSKKMCVKKFQSMLPIKSGSQETRTAAVLIPLCIYNQQVSLLYTLRAANLNTHRGQVSFPGGMRDNKDRTLEMTALRETYEELGIHPNDVELWGSGNIIVTKQNMGILPVVGCLKKDLHLEKLMLNNSEVEEVFAVPISELCKSDLHGYTQFRNTYSTPVFFGGQHRIWGLTAVITHFFLKSLLPSKAYKHAVTYLPNISSS